MRHPAARFVLVGVLNTAVYYGTYLLLRLLLPYLAAHLLAVVVSMVGSFFLNCLWTFRTRPTWRKFALFPLTNLTNYVLVTGGVVVLVEGPGFDQRIAPLIAALAAVPVTYLLSRRLLAGRRRRTVTVPDGPGVAPGPRPAAPAPSPSGSADDR